MKKAKKGTLTRAKQDCWDIFSLLIKLTYSRDGEHVHCYTCGKRIRIGTSDCQGCHFWPKGVYSGLYFYFNNVRPGCYYCNINLEGNRLIFAEKLIKEIGQDEFDKMASLRSVPVKRTKWDYQCMAEEYKVKINELRVKFKNQ